MKIFRAVLAAALCLTVFSGCGPNAENTKPASDDKAFLTITDDTGRTVVLPEKPERVVSLATSYLNMIDAVLLIKIDMRNFFRFWSLIKYLLLQSIQKHMMR